MSNLTRKKISNELCCVDWNWKKLIMRTEWIKIFFLLSSIRSAPISYRPIAISMFPPFAWKLSMEINKKIDSPFCFGLVWKKIGCSTLGHFSYKWNTVFLQKSELVFIQYFCFKIKINGDRLYDARK